MSESRTLTITVAELASTIEALHDAILRRMKWCTSSEYTHWRNLQLDTVQSVVDSLVSA
jgi:hypothetical protein